MRKGNGITLISLVITIIVLIILAGVSVNFIFGDGGIINRAIEGKKNQNIARLTEMLELEKGELEITELGKLDLEKYLEQIIRNGIIEEGDIDRINEDSVNITLEGEYVFLIEKEEPNNIKIEYMGETGKIKPKIEILSINKTTNSIAIDFKLKNATKYKLYIKEEGKEYIKRIEESVNVNKLNYEFDNLENGKTYIIKIEAETEKGIKNITEEKIVLNAISDLSINVEDEETWTKETKTVTITTSNSNYTKIVYTTNNTIPSLNEDGTIKNGIQYTDKFTVNSNCVITAIAFDNINQAGIAATNEITKIDKTAPTKTTVNLNGYSSGNWTNGNVVITSTSTDTQSGIDYYQYSTDGVNVAGNIGDSWTINWDGQWNFYIRAVDKVGNIGEWSDTFIVRRDATAPETLNINLTPSKTSIRVDVTAASDKTSGIVGYRFSKDNGATWTGYQTGTSYTFSELYGNLAGQSYTIKVETKDNAGNIKQVSNTATTTCLNNSYYRNTTGLLVNLDYYGSRDYYKNSTEGSIHAIAYYHGVPQGGNNDWVDVITVGNTEASVSVSCSYDNATHPKYTTNYHGTVYYFSWGHPLWADATISNTNLVRLNSVSNIYSAPDVAVLELLNRYYQ